MSRRHAGHGWTRFHVGEKRVDLLMNDAGQWITTGEARGWPRCTRCRVPFETSASPELPTLCAWCLPADMRRKLRDDGHPLFSDVRWRVGMDEATMRTLGSLQTGRAKNWKRTLRPGVAPKAVQHG